jgi:prevent-host-death family protein
MDISVAEAHNKLSQLLQAAEQEPIVITRRGKPVGVLITPQEYAEVRKLRAYLEMLQLAEELRNSGTTAQELQQLSRAELEARA